MRYMLLICSDDKAAPPTPRAEMEAIVQGHRRFSDELQAAGKMVVGERLRPDGDASRIRLKAGQRQVMDGPFAETKEGLGGFYLIECDSREEAVEWAKQIPLGEGRFWKCGRSGRCDRYGNRSACVGYARSMTLKASCTMSLRGTDGPRAGTGKRPRTRRGNLPPGVRPRG